MSAPEIQSDLFETWDEEHVEHSDERWLISYADMMTLLFGLFVMLYTMQDRMNEVQDAAKKQFLSGTEQKIDPKVLETDAIKSRVETLEQQLQATKYQLADATSAKDDLAQKLKSAEQNLDSMRYESKRRTDELAEINARRDQLRQEREAARSEMPVMPPPSQGVGGAAARSGSPGGGGGSGSGSPTPPAAPATAQARFRLSFTLPNGTIFDAQTNQVGLNGIQLDEPIPSVVAGEQFKGVITKDGESVEVIVQNMVGENGQASERFRILIFPNLDRPRLETMLKKKQP
jgi:flagellar motor protein MotB